MDQASDLRRRSCTLIITHQCNLNCVYCYEHYKSDKTMSMELAKSIIEKEFDFVAKSDSFDEIIFDFLGGEPLLRFDFLVELAEWIWSKPRPVPYLLFATTNGTLLDATMKSWFKTNADKFPLSLSIDGTPAMNLLSRGVEYSSIDVQFFLLTWPLQSIKMTIALETLPMLADGVIYLQKKGLKIRANLGYGIPWGPQHLSIYVRELKKLSMHYLQHPQEEVLSLLDADLSAMLRKNILAQKYCGTGTHMITYDIDGLGYPCHLFTPFVLGNDKSSICHNFDFQDVSILLDPKCNNCFIRHLCPTCYGFNYQLTGNIAIRDVVMCDFFKEQFKAAASFQACKLAQKKVALTKKDIITAKAIVKFAEVM